MTRHIWYLVTLISLGGCFELYDLFLTAYIAPGLNRAGYFTPESLGVFNILGPLHVAGIGTFVFALFAGLFVGAICLGHVADQYGRRTVFTFSWSGTRSPPPSWRSRPRASRVDLWRFIAGIGIGVELVTIDTYVAELVPLHPSRPRLRLQPVLPVPRRADRGVHRLAAGAARRRSASTAGAGWC